MNPKCTLRDFLFGKKFKKENLKPIKSFTYLLLITVLLLSVSTTDNFAKTIAQEAFPTKIVKTFNKKVIDDLSPFKIATTTMATVSPCPDGSGIIGGKAFQDFNYNGIDDQIGAGLAGIEVYVIGCGSDGSSQSITSTTTDENGEYFLSDLTDGEVYRVEFIIPESMNFLQSGFNGADTRTTVQFLTSPTCGANIGLTNPADFCEEDPFLAIPCFVNGDPMAANSGSASEDALVLFKTSYEKNNPKPTTLSTAIEIGATWGITYNKASKRLFTSAFLKRHVGFGPLGIGGLYQIDLSGTEPVTTPFIDVNSIGINVGTYANNSARGLFSNTNLPSSDTEAFDDVGKKGIGGLCMSEDGELLYLVNLTEKKLHSIRMGLGAPTSGDVQSYTLPDPGCSGGAFRPFAVHVNRGKVYVGGVCDAETSGNKSDLRAIVYRLDGNNFTEVLNFSLDYTKGLASRSCEDDRGWFPWTNQLPEPCFVSGSTNNIIVHPTPHLTAFEFDSGGDLILGFTDRMGNQLGFINYPPNGTDKLYSAFTGGDILKAGRNQDGSFTIENNGTVGNNTTSGVDNEEGPGGGEFYNMDIYEIASGVPIPHNETAQGGLTLVKGTGQVITTALDPFGTFVNSGGVNYLDNKTGDIRDPGYVVFQSGSSSPSTFAKANGLGDLVALCGEAPIEIGGRIWKDLNENGIQDPCEAPLPGVKIALFEADGVLGEPVITDANGEYYFNGTGTNPEIKPNSTYSVVIGYSDQFDNINNSLLDSFFLTSANTGMAPNPDLNDSDGIVAGSGNVFQGYPSITVETGKPGSVTHDNDAGFFVMIPAPKADITGLVFNDLDQDGLQGGNEPNIAGVTVTLFNADGTEVANTTTDVNGNYVFDNIMQGDYYIVVDVSTNTVGTPNFLGTIQDAGDDDFDSDVDPNTGQSVTFSHNPADGNTDLDAGFFESTGTISGFVWNDLNENGLQNADELGIAGTNVDLVDGNGNVVATTTTDANGNYVFDNIMGGNYYVVFDISTNTAGVSTYEGTIQDAGDDNLDSDVDPNTGRTPTFSFNPADGNADYDAGYFEGTGILTGQVFVDLNENGLQDPNEPGIGGVEVVVVAPDGTVINTGVSEPDGSFAVDGIPSGTVTVLFDPDNNSEDLENLTPTIKDVNDNQNDDTDSDINPNKEADPIEFDASVGADIDAGFFISIDPVMIGDFVFKDCNENGIQDPEEVGVPNVLITLSGKNHLGESVRMETTSNSTGKYNFVVSGPGTYSLNFDIPEEVTGLEFSPRGQGGNNALDSDVNPISGVTEAFTIESGESNLTIDAGIIDKAPPLIFNVPPDITVDCNDIPNSPSVIKGVDNCDPSIEVIFSERTLNADSCPYTIERTWTAVDDCGNSTIRTQNITVTDTEAPIITPANPLLVGIESGGEITFNCDNLPEFTAADVNVTDNCSDVAVKFVDLIREEGNCEEDGYIIKMTCGWSAVDDCGNKSEFLIVIFVVDTKSPTLNNIPEDLTINLDQGQFVPPVGNTVTATDNCDEFVRIEFTETQTAGVCGYELLRTWIGYDDCGNKVVESQKLTLLEDCTCPDELVSNTLVWDAACDGSEGGKIILDLTADIDKYDISITPNLGKTNLIKNMFTDLPPGDYKVSVSYDAIENCSETLFFTVNMAVPSIIQIEERTKADCFTSNGSVTLAPANYTYKWSDGGTGAQRNDLAVGEYIVNFTDENGCENSQIINIKNPKGCECSDFAVNLLWEIMPTCNGFTNGQVDIEIVGGTAPYTYLWHDGQTTKDLFGVAAGPYSLTATDSKGCTATLSGELNQPDAILTVETLMNGVCGEKGAIDLFVSGGTAPYTYAWSNGATTEDLTNLTTGSYSVTIIDANKCQEDLTVNVNNYGDINVNLISNNPTCTDNTNGNITATVSGGTSPYTYEWSNGATSSSINNVGAGTYAVMVTDGTGCKSMAEITLEAPVAIEVIAEVDALDCDGGDISVMVSGGTAPYTYNWSNGALTQNISDVEAGNYSVTVTDANGCSQIANTSIAAISNISVKVDDSADPSCFGGSDGFIQLTVSGGILPYAIQWTNGETTEDISNLAAGFYGVTIADSRDCKIVLDALLNDPEPLKIETASNNPACPEDMGDIDINISGGRTPYQYNWSNGATTEDIEGLLVGRYTVVVTDANGCTLQTSADIKAASQIVATLNITGETCATYDGLVDLTVSGGSEPYTYEWSTGAVSQDLEDLAKGTYTVTIYDTKGCSITKTAIVNDNCVCPSPLVNTNVVTSSRCGEANGSIVIMVNGAIDQYQFEWESNNGIFGAYNNERTELLAGTYNVTVTFANKPECSEVLHLSIENKDGITGSVVSNTPATCGEDNGEVILSSEVSYQWPDGSESKNRSNLAPGTYQISVLDDSGCESFLSVTVTQKTCPVTCDLEVEIAGVKAPDCDWNLGSINLDVIGGTSPYNYNWNDNSIGNVQNPVDLSAGNYQVEVTDANGCTASVSVELKEEDCGDEVNCDMILSLQATDLTCGKNNGSIEAHVLNGTAPFRFRWSTGDKTNKISNLPAGRYGLDVIDANDCAFYREIDLKATDNLSISGEIQHATCGQEDGSIDITVTGGTTPYTYEWNHGDIYKKDQHNLGPNDFHVTVTDATNCTITESFLVKDCGGEPFGFVTVDAAFLGDQNISVNWETKNETMLGTYTVLHSTDRKNFRVIGRAMEGKGSTELANYEMEGEGSFGINYFRIKYLDNRGNEYLSDIVEVMVTIPENTFRSSIPAIIYPNPTSDEFVLDFAKSIEEEVTVIITDIDGVLLEQVILESGTAKKIFNVIDYESGIYQVSLKQGRKKLVTYRLIKTVK